MAWKKRGPLSAAHKAAISAGLKRHYGAGGRQLNRPARPNKRPKTTVSKNEGFRIAKNGSGKRVSRGGIKVNFDPGKVQTMRKSANLLKRNINWVSKRNVNGIPTPHNANRYGTQKKLNVRKISGGRNVSARP